MSGLQKVLKIHGQIQCGDVTWIWDYATETARMKKDMTKKEIAAAAKAHKEKGILRDPTDGKVEYGPKH